MRAKRPLSRSERASKYAEQCPLGKRFRDYAGGVITTRSLLAELQNAYMAGWNEKDKMDLNKARGSQKGVKA